MRRTRVALVWRICAAHTKCTRAPQAVAIEMRRRESSEVYVRSTASCESVGGDVERLSDVQLSERRPRERAGADSLRDAA
jgi:hypothetical protein